MIVRFGIIIAAIATLIIISTSITQLAAADRNDKPHKGSMGQCLKINRELDLGGSKEDCHDSFTGKGHGDDGGPLP